MTLLVVFVVRVIFDEKFNRNHVVREKPATHPFRTSQYFFGFVMW